MMLFHKDGETPPKELPDGDGKSPFAKTTNHRLQYAGEKPTKQQHISFNIFYLSQERNSSFSSNSSKKVLLGAPKGCCFVGLPWQKANKTTKNMLFCWFLPVFVGFKNRPVGPAGGRVFAGTARCSGGAQEGRSAPRGVVFYCKSQVDSKRNLKKKWFQKNETFLK